MIHLGDITKLKGNEVPIVDCAIGGSPCQDLSMAGLRKGFDGDRSVLYTDQIRIGKEMREHDKRMGRSGVDVRPRYMVWENVPGAFSTNGGKDFAAVLEEAIRVAEPEAPSVSVPKKGWPTAGSFMGECWSIAWRVLDAQFWGTSDKPLPQRRRRIALVADFGGQSAPEILFVRKSVSGNIEPGEPKRKEDPGDAGEGFGGASYAIQGSMIGRADKNGPQGDGINKDVSFTLNTTDRHAVVYGISPYHSNCMKSDNHTSGYYEAETYRTLDAMNCGYPGCNQGGMAVVQTVGTYQETGFGWWNESDVGATIRAMSGDATKANLVVAGVDCRNNTEYPGMIGTIQSHPGAGSSLNCNQVVRVNHIVRRLTPLECERLQGFPDGWTLLPKIEDMVDAEYEFWKTVLLEREKREGRARENDDGVIEVWRFIEGEDDEDGEWVNTHKPYKHKTREQMVRWYNGMIEADSSRYKALGNSIALPPWKWVLKRLCACYERDATMASLFDGIGGFPLIWEQINGKGSCLWASEIEEFPIAVTKVRFGE